jgi:HAD superfamily hydrolase (TIGR01509 family)
MIKTIIFDFDGTLADCKKLHQDGFRSAVARYARHFDYDDTVVEGRPTREKIRILNTMGANLNAEWVNEYKQAHTQTHIEQYVKYNPEIHAELERLSTIYQLCLASNATAPFIQRSLEIMRISDFFSRINTATHFPAKPDTTTFVDCMNYTHATPAETAIFEDSPVGIQCARSTGATVVEVVDVEDTVRKMRNF